MGEIPEMKQEADLGQMMKYGGKPKIECTKKKAAKYFAVGFAAGLVISGIYYAGNFHIYPLEEAMSCIKECAIPSYDKITNSPIEDVSWVNSME